MSAIERDSLGLRYRAERRGEEAHVREVVQDAFGLPVVADLVDHLRQSPDWIEGLSFVAEHDDRLIGHILFTRSLLDAPAGSSTCCC